MKQIIKDVLNDMSEGQINLGSESARETVSSLISAALKTKGIYTEYTDEEIEEQAAKEFWVCDICGQSTYDVEYDYLASQTRHLKCQLEYENENSEGYTDDTEKDEKYWSRIQSYMEMSSGGLPEDGDDRTVIDSHKLAEEIVDNKKGKYIYESPDGGETVFRRPFGDCDPKNKEHIDWETKEPTGKTFLDYPWHTEKKK